MVRDSSAGGDAGTAVMSAASSSDQTEEPALRSWPPKSHISSAPVPGNTAATVMFSSCGQNFILVHGQVTIIFVVSVGLSVCLFICLFVCLFLCAEFLNHVA